MGRYLESKRTVTMFLDPRAGSGELLPYFKPYDVPVEVVQLDAADIAFCGNGPDGACLVGFERKVLTDLISSMRSERFAGEQLQKLMDQYRFFSIVVEGIWRAGLDGSVQIKPFKGDWVPVRVGSRPVMFREVDHWLATLEHVVGSGVNLTVVRTADPAQTVAYLVSRYKWWNDKEWVEHNSYRAIYSPDVPNPPGRKGFTLPKPGPVEEVSCRFPGVREKAWSFGKKFETVVDMVNADEKTLAGVDGIGKKGAARIYAWLRSKRNGDGGWNSQL